MFSRAKLTSLESELDQLETEQKAGQGILDTDKVRYSLFIGEFRHFPWKGIAELWNSQV